MRITHEYCDICHNLVNPIQGFGDSANHTYCNFSFGLSRLGNHGFEVVCPDCYNALSKTINDKIKELKNAKVSMRSNL